MAIVAVIIKDYLSDRWEESKSLVLEQPLTALIYSIAMKFFGFYCRNSFWPLGGGLFLSLFITSLVIDTSALSQAGVYGDALLKNIDNIKANLFKHIHAFYQTHIAEMGKRIIAPFFGPYFRSSHA